MSKLLPLVLKVAVPDPAGVTRYHTDLQISSVPGSELSSVAEVLLLEAEPLVPIRTVAQLRLSLTGDPVHDADPSDQFSVMAPT